ncbi:MerR family transcriptional regulator [Alginatibacterium sediminis]|uniref:MerR family transcriptional regulator n=1 Tax=Alginatibacterium sediminis TaxID=2164068 RepID=A0A420ENK4_9ALTE|nr:MerR family transcriptional regulator [Alginatibacterium sediminis]RKF22174.1 MerR family transcriptional regulator [Alginatibacterium sediminis]
MRTSELAQQAQVSPETVRYYTRSGLLVASRNTSNGYREYGYQALTRLRFIRKARQIGFSLKEITEILEYENQANSPCYRVKELLSLKIPETQQQIAELQRHLVSMQNTLQSWSNQAESTPDGHSICRLIEQWSEPDAQEED